MLHFKNYVAILFTVIFLCTSILSCNNSEDKAIETSVTDTIAIMDTATTASPAVDSTIAQVESAGKIRATKPKASIAYAYKNKMKKGKEELIQMDVQLDKPLENVTAGLKKSLNEEKAIETGSSDTSIVKSINIEGDKYFLVTLDYDTSVFFIVRSFGKEKQELKYDKPNKWIWRVTAKKETSKSEILIIVKSEDVNGIEHQSDFNRLPIEITVDTAAGTEESQASFFSRYSWLLFSASVIIILLIILYIWRKRKLLKEINSRIYFSYAWNKEKDTIIDKLYLSLQKDGFNVIRDKVNLKYKGLISNFMKDIGKGNIIIIALSDKYLKSRFCMFELYEIYRNCGMSKEEFVKKIFPIREEDINLSDAAVIDRYVDYWNEEELKLEAIVKDKSQETTSEQFAQYEAIRRIESELGNLLYFLSDINALNVELLSNNDFAEIKSSLRIAIKSLDES